jgi:hypothetical protein
MAAPARPFTLQAQREGSGQGDEQLWLQARLVQVLSQECG